MTDPRTGAGRGLRIVVRLPAHVVVFLGLSTAAYAVSLAGVTALQSRSEAELQAERAPAIASVDTIAAQNAHVADALQAASQSYAAVVQGYESAGGRLADLQVALNGLAASVAQINGVATQLPTTVALPRMARQTAGGAPATSATTGASGAP